MKILIVNGPNLDRLGKREVNIYGNMTLEEINNKISNHFKGKVEIDFFQSNEEGAIINTIAKAEEHYQAIVINPAAYSHYSIAILDSIRGVDIPVIEVHLSNIYSREQYRKNSVTAEGAIGVISGFGWQSYILAIEFLISKY
ncbi:type II 3-dehydroquinate dehydratase [Clostridium sp. MSJ-4]|uniref:3-dehydroquinate dehydratase n=1 Tax=Clostridium simiarum TaxID=2841506 RepID=A0ABS6EXN7_9CLOT|nr:type II 3-dehydroquinate dehydratase [Clostridium simiarum]MBU5590763.1 type II 3-dehydroquinate dehydratase [Clostridium simiarum]